MSRLPVSVCVMVAFTAMALVWLNAQSAPAQTKPALDKGTLVINLTCGKEDIQKATMAIHLAEHGLTDGKKVVLFLNVRAPELASKNAPATWVFGKNPPAPEMLRDLIKRGAVILVCPQCMETAGQKKDDLIEGAQVASRESLFGTLGPTTAVFSY